MTAKVIPFLPRAVRSSFLPLLPSPPMTPFQVRHCYHLFAALYVSESWHLGWRFELAKKPLYSKAKAVVSFDRVLNLELNRK
jgi:hypothetical protein